MEAARAAPILRYSAGEAFRPVASSSSRRSPAGRSTRCAARSASSALITPWNFPAAIPVWKLAPALIYGNTIVLEARAGRAADRAAHRACARRRGAAAGRAERGDRPRFRVGTPLVAHPARARALVHRLRAGRRGRPRDGDGARQARPARARRPQPADRDWPTPSWSAPPRPPTRARSGRPGRSARRRGASTCRTAPTTSSATPARAGGGGKVGDPADPRPRSARSSTSARWTTSWRGRAGAVRGRLRPGGRRARRRRGYLSRRPSSRTSPTTPCSPARRCSAR